MAQALCGLALGFAIGSSPYFACLDQRAREMGMLGPTSEWNWVGVDGWLQQNFPSTDLCDAACTADNVAAMAGVTGTAPFSNVTAKNAWLTNVWDPTTGPGKLTPAQITGSNLTSWAGSNLNSFAPFSYDAATALSYAMHRVCFAPTVGGLTPVANATKCRERLVGGGVGEQLYQELLKVDFFGPTGRVQFDANGDRPSDYDILNLDTTGTLKVVGRWNGFSDTISMVRKAVAAVAVAIIV